MKKNDLIAAGLTEDQAAKILELHTADLAKKEASHDLLKQLKEEKAAAEKRAQALEQEKEEARLKAMGDLEGLKKHYDQQAQDLKNKLESELEETRNALKMRDQALELTSKKIAKEKILQSVDPRFSNLAARMLDDDITVKHDESGAPLYNIKIGDQSFSNESDFLAAAKEDSVWRSVLRADLSTGSGAGSSNAGGAADNKDAAFDARLRAAGLI